MSGEGEHEIMDKDLEVIDAEPRNWKALLMSFLFIVVVLAMIVAAAYVFSPHFEVPPERPPKKYYPGVEREPWRKDFDHKFDSKNQESSCAVLKYLVREYGVENRELTPREKHVAREIMRLLDQTD